MAGRTLHTVLLSVLAAFLCAGCKQTPQPDVQASRAPAAVQRDTSGGGAAAIDAAVASAADQAAEAPVTDVVAAPETYFMTVDIVLSSLQNSDVAAEVVDGGGVVPGEPGVAADVVGSADAGEAVPLADVKSVPTDVATPADAVPAGDGAAVADRSSPGPTDAVPAPAPDVATAPTPDGVAGPTPGAVVKPMVDEEASRKVFEEFKKLVEAADFEKGARLLEEWLKKSPMDLVNRQNLVYILLKLEQHERALPHLRFMADEAENKGEWLGHLGRALAKVGEYARAAEALTEGLELRPDDMDMLLDLARVHSTRKDWSASRAVLEEGLSLEKRQPEVLSELVAVLVELGEYKLAFQRFRNLQRLQPTYDTALTMAKVASQNERCDDVVDALVNWEKDFADETPHLLLGACAVKSEEQVKAQKHFLLGLKANEKCFYCALWLGDIHFAAEDWDNAVKYYATAAPINPRDHRPFHQLGKALANQGKHIQATRALQKADERKPKDPDILYPLGMELVRAGEKAAAWDVWAKLEPLDRARGDEIKALLVQ